MCTGGGFHGLQIDLRRLPGAHALRVIHPQWQTIDGHRHDWASLTIYALGSYDEIYDDIVTEIRGPSIVLHPPGAEHANRINAVGLETISVQLDPWWLRMAGFDRPIERTHCWQGGKVAKAARKLAGSWTNKATSETELARSTAHFLATALSADPISPPAWLDRVGHSLNTLDPPTTDALAKQLDLHPAWLARAYRHAVGEGLHETVRRRRVERAVRKLRNTSLGLADIAASTGFCDQSHMNRCFKAIAGRTPLQVREERRHLAMFA